MATFAPIAVVGIGAHFPGARDLDHFWQNLLEGRSQARAVPSPRWAFQPEQGRGPDQSASTIACVLEDEVPGDPTLDPVCRLALLTGRQAFEQGRTEHLDRSRVGVILAAIALPTARSSAHSRELFAPVLEGRPAGRLLASDQNPVGLPAARLARELGLGGTAFTLDAACASSLYAVKLACDELTTGRADAMLAGGLNQADSLYTNMGFTALQALSPSGRCAPFDSRADGLVVGEGGAFFLLKRLQDARRDGDAIHGVIRGIGLSNDMGGSLLAPDSEGQLRAMREAYRQADWKPEQVDLVECHGTGTPAGDQTEFASLCRMWEGTSARCSIGSVKSNIGHLLTGAGAAALAKVLLALRHQTLPPSANFEQPGVPLEQSPFEVPVRPRVWPDRAGHPRRAAVSGFGFGGVNAHLLVEEHDPSLEPTVPAAREPRPVAIVGMAAHFGPLDTTRRWLQAALQGQSAVAPRPPGRWNGLENELGVSAQEHPGAYIDEVALQEGRFRVPPRDLPLLLPQQLLMLNVAADAVEDAGIRLSGRNERVGALIGVSLDADTNNFHLRWAAPPRDREQAAPPLDAPRTLGALASIAASRVARELALGGPSFTVSAGEASGLVALDIAVGALERGELDVALVGAVDLAGDPRVVLSPPRPYGNGRALQQGADGPPVGEGAVALVLKRLEDCDGDRIYALVRGRGYSTAGLSPAIERAAGDELRTRVTYVETHGSADPAQDREEAACLSRHYGRGETPCALGALMPVIGWTRAAAGLAGLARAAAALHYQTLPAMPWFTTPLPELTGRFYVTREPAYWFRDRLRGPRLAAVNSLAEDGPAAHILLEEVEDKVYRPALLTPPVGVLTAESSQLEELAAHLASRGDDPSLADAPGEAVRLAREWHRHHPQPSGEQVVALVGRTREQLTAALDHLRRHLDQCPDLALPGQSGVFYNPRPVGALGQVAFVYPGSGNHFLGMGRQLALYWPQAARALDAESEELASHLMVSEYLPCRLDYRPGWEGDAHRRIAADPHTMIFGQVAFGILATRVARELGLCPSACLGYSLGESAGLFSLGAWSGRDEMYHRIQASDLFRMQLSGPCLAARQALRLGPQDECRWKVAVVNRPAPAVRAALEAGADLLIVNTDEECVVGGLAPAVDRVVAKLGCEAFPLEGVPTVHSPVAAPVEQAYYALHLLPTRDPGVRFYSGNWGRSYEMSQENAARSILDQALHGLDYPAVVRRAWEDGVRCFLEMGPAGSCSRMIDSILADRPHLTRSLSLPDDEVSGVMRMLAALIVERVPGVSLAPLYAGPDLDAVAARPAIRVRPGANLPRPGPPHSTRGVPVMSGTATPGPAPAAAPMLPPEAPRRPGPTPVPVAAPVLSLPAPALPVPGPPPFLPGPALAPLPSSLPLLAAGQQMEAWLVESSAARAAAHETFLRFSAENLQAMGQAVELQTRLLEGMIAGGQAFPVSPVSQPQVAPPSLPLAAPLTPHAPWAAPAPDPPTAGSGLPGTTTRAEVHDLMVVASPAGAPPPAAPVSEKPFMDRADCMEFAIGSIGKALGPEFAPVDAHPTRVRLPDQPLMLADRIMRVEGEPRSLSSGSVVTEHDVIPGIWYLDSGRAPVCISVEAGQADLFLSGWLGIDFTHGGHRVYRLLDAEVTFHRGLPRAGETIRYDIFIDRFVRQGETYLFFFRFDGTIDGKPLITMRNGCAGFFTYEEIAGSGGILEDATPPAPGALPPDWHPLVPFERAEAYSDEQVEALRRGDLEGCFGPQFAGLGLENPLRLPGPPMNLLHRVLEVDPKGGRYGLGRVRAEADVHPDDWFLTCHFVDDMVMPGTLMYECCAHTLRFFLLRLGWVAEAGQVACEPIQGMPAVLRCRGPVTARTKKVIYQVDIQEIGYRPEPYVLVEALMMADGKPIVKFTGMSMQLTGQTRESLQRLWQARGTHPRPDLGATGYPMPAALSSGSTSPFSGKPVRFDARSIMEFSVGSLVKAFGENYRPFDEGRRIARLPGPPYLFMDRVVELNDPPWELRAGDWIESEYDLSPEVWYFKANRQPTMAFCVLLEIALQPCGWLAAYLGSALRSPQDTRFRNLGGQATLHREIWPDSGTLRVRVKMTDVNEAAGMIIENFAMEVHDRHGLLYEGTTYFGFFSEAALAQQVGVRDAPGRAYQPDAPGRSFPLPRVAPLSPEDLALLPGDRACLPARALLMMDEVECYLPEGGPTGLGFIRGVKTVDPGEWFFKAHFYQDPVWPGSLGLEAFLQLMKVVMLDRWPRMAHTHRFEAIALGRPHTWAYRGQVIPPNRRVEVEVAVTKVEEGESPVLTADGFLKVDGLHIYEMKDFALRLVPSYPIRG